ncbi:hypothetical protein ACWEKT_09325 [Nocardia takedensis]
MRTPDSRERRAESAPTPRAFDALARSGSELASLVRGQILHSPRPVFLYYLTQTFDSLTDRFAENPATPARSPAERLCLELMIGHAESADACSPEDAARLRAALIPDEGESPLRWGRPATESTRFDFIALGDRLSACGMSAFFAPFDPEDLAA